MISKNFNKIFQLILVLICCFVCIPKTALADGIYIPEIAYAKLPDMPFQRAVLTYHDGIETLIIESSLEAEGTSFGWIIPLPAVPTKLKEVSPGFLKTMSVCLQPKIIHDFGGLIFLVFWTIVITYITLRNIFKKKPALSRFYGSFALILFLFILLGMTLGALGGLSFSPFHKIAGIKIQSASQVGNYNVAILNADNTDALDTWLTTNGFAKIPEAGEKIVSDYITSGWCFVTVKLQRKGSGFSSPHPLLMSFQTKRPVYPMKLTALAGSELYLELFVCADKRADVKKLKLDYCDNFIFEEYQSYNSIESHHVGIENHQNIGHPEAKNIFWEDCVITKLSAKLTPEQMNKDFDIRFVPFKPYRRHFYSYKGALRTSLTVFLICWCLGLLISLFVYNISPKIKLDVSHPFSQCFFPLLGICIFIGLIIFVTVPKIKVVTSKRFIPPKFYLVDMHKLASNFLKEQPAAQTNEIKVIEQKLINIFKKEKLKNVFTGEIIKAEDSPGNFVIERKNGKIVMKVYYINGAPIKKELPFNL